MYEPTGLAVSILVEGHMLIHDPLSVGLNLHIEHRGLGAPNPVRTTVILE